MKFRCAAWRLVAAAWVGAVVAGGCSSDLPARRPPFGTQCADTTRAGRFVLWLTAPGAGSASGSAQLDGTVWDRPPPGGYRRTVVAEGRCALTEDDAGIACAPACTGDEICYPDGTCAPSAVSHSVGTIELTGLDRPVSLDPALDPDPVTGGSVTYASNAGDVPYPGAAPGAAVTLRASGGDYAPFMLTAAGLTPLRLPADALPITRDQPLTIEWNAPSPQEPTRLNATLALADDTPAGGNVPGNPAIVCTFRDTGTGTVPASLVTALIDRGVGGAPILGLQRMTIDSTEIDPGCVDFLVASPSAQPIVVP